MNGEFLAWANAGYTQAVAAAATVALFAWLRVKWKDSSAVAKTEAKRKLLRWGIAVLQIAQYLFIFSLIWKMLGPLLELETLPTRMEVLKIAVCTVFAAGAVTILVIDLALSRRGTRRP